MQNETEQRSGYLPVLLIILAIVLFLWFVCWWDAQPKQLLSRFLDVKWSEKMTRIESDYYGGFDMTTHIYLEADAETIRNIIEKGDFVLSATEPTSESISRLNFGDAPEAHAEPLIHYHRHFQNTVHEYLAVTPDGLRLWYTAVDY